jgi:hypothetical protein
MSGGRKITNYYVLEFQGDEGDFTKADVMIEAYDDFSPLVSIINEIEGCASTTNPVGRYGSFRSSKKVNRSPRIATDQPCSIALAI